ncbi:hypothetical protein BDA96_05G190400 [Sorghum bicolor]|uniref:Bifunctional inhibitor/plant lipid transfer protein/seed storage helical domain-containing protein n=1 Tax=Sorghum bicolor TaxID=4558 RepID=A0A921R131_SORBI|nr:hypothetical protein BDA96_05G190400 [Sorghum bicolor]
MRTECAALCIVLVIMSSSLSSSKDVVQRIGLILPGCTLPLCQTSCSEFAKKNGAVVKMCFCAAENNCECLYVKQQHPLLTTEVMGLAAAEDDNGTFV